MTTSGLRSFTKLDIYCSITQLYCFWRVSKEPLTNEKTKRINSQKIYWFRIALDLHYVTQQRAIQHSLFAWLERLEFRPVSWLANFNIGDGLVATDSTC